MKTMAKRFTVLLSVLFLFIVPASLFAQKTSAELVADANKVIKTVTVAEAKQMIDKGNVIVLDVREQNEYDAERIPQAILIPRGFLEFQIAAKVPDKGAAMIVHCRSGGRSALAVQTLQIMGYNNVYNLKGGMIAWQAAALPTEKGPK